MYKYYKKAHENIRAVKRCVELGYDEVLHLIYDYTYSSYLSTDILDACGDDEDAIVGAYDNLADCNINDFHKYGIFNLGDYDLVRVKEEEYSIPT